MIGERVSYCFNKLWPDPADAYGSTLSLHAGAARLAATPPPTFSYQALSSRRATAGPRWSTPCLWPGPSLERETATDNPGSKPPPVFRLSGVIFCVAGARRLPLCLVRAVWWPRRRIMTRRRIKLTAASSASAAAHLPAAGAPSPPPRLFEAASVCCCTCRGVRNCAAPYRSSSAAST